MMLSKSSKDFRLCFRTKQMRSTNQPTKKTPKQIIPHKLHFSTYFFSLWCSGKQFSFKLVEKTHSQTAVARYRWATHLEVKQYCYFSFPLFRINNHWAKIASTQLFIQQGNCLWILPRNAQSRRNFFQKCHSSSLLRCWRLDQNTHMVEPSFCKKSSLLHED